MVKIKILDRGFMTTHYGWLEANSEPEVSPGFADWCVDRMKSATRVEMPKPVRKKATKK